jgi:haloalkane dehalogenase
MQAPSWLDRRAYPFHPGSFDSAEGRIRYLDEGRGRPILIVHGTPSWSFEWRHVVRELAGEFRVIVPDHLGFGLSDKPRDPTILRPADHARRLRELAAALDLEDAIIVAHDFGGPIAMPLVLDDRRRVAGMVAINTWCWAGDARSRRLSALVRSPLGRLLYRRLNASPRWLVPMAFGDRRTLDRATHRHYLAPFGSWSERAAPWVLGVELAGSDAWYEALWSRRAELAELPLALVWGMRDPAFGPAALARWIEAFPSATVDRLPGCGHFPAEEAPDRVVAAIRGLAAKVAARREAS